MLDIDSTDDDVHGRQEGRFFHGYDGHYCFLPLYITCGGRPLFALLKPGNSDAAGGVTGPLGRIVARLRQEWPWLEILLRADSAHAREELLAWCEDIGVAKNSRLIEKIGWELADAQTEAAQQGRPARRFAEFLYATLTSWSRRRRVVAKAEHLPGKSNPRFVVTSLPADTFSARNVYERVYPGFLKRIGRHRPPGAVKFMWGKNLTATTPEDRCRHSVNRFPSHFKGAGAAG